MSGAKRSKLEDYSFLPNNVQAIAIKNAPADFLATTKRISTICNNSLYCGELQTPQLAQTIQEKHNNIRFAAVLSQHNIFIYAIAHPTICSQRHLATILKKLTKPNEKSNSTQHNPTKNWTPQLNYWEKRLENVQLELDLTLHFNKSSPDGAEKCDFRISASKIRQFCTKFELQTSVFIFSLFQTFLYKYSHQTTFSIRTFIDNFDNPMCIPCAIVGERTFLDLLRQNQTDFANFASFSNVPFQLIECEILSDKKNNISFNFYDNFDVSWHNCDTNATLAFDVHERPHSFHATFRSNNKHFGRHKLDKMAAHFRQILVDCIDNSQRKVSNYSLLSSQDENLFQKWNQTQQEVDFDVSIPQMFDNQVGRSGDKMAVMCDDKSITYSQLDARITSFVAYLYHQGVKSSSVVGVCMEKCIDLVVVLVAILKTGSCYVAIDPSFPTERIKFIIENSHVEFAITTKELENKLPPTRPAILVENFDSQKHEASSHHYHVTSSAPAYIIYTSGTTGRPKGVKMTHRNVVCFVNGTISTFKSRETKGILISASPSFCLFHGLLYYALAEGSAAILAPSLLHVPEIQFKEQISFIATPPAGFRRLMTDQSLPKSLKIVLLGGDFIPRDLVADLHRIRPDLQIFMGYGCTEATLTVLCAQVPPNGPLKVSAGAPVSNVKVYILDENLHKVPVDFVGELCLSGPQVADGYLNLESSDAFLKNPFEFDGLYEKIYRTGDLARWNDDGHVEIVGRMNSMTKINGIRIELDEIANVLLEHDAILEAVVSVAAVNNSDLLVAYCATKEIESFDEIKEYLLLNLPRYMVPQVYVKMEKLPRNLNGKVDRHRLPPPPPSDGGRENYETIPKSETENRVLAIVRSLLSKSISLSDNLLENGLNSILATQLVIDLEKMFQIKMAVPLVYDCKHTAGLCRHIDCKLHGADVHKPLDLNNAAILSDDVTAEAAHGVDIIRAVNPNYILLTGATGFVGAFVLAELLTTTKAYIYCLVRAASSVEASERVRQNLEFYKLWHSEYESKLTVLLGDVTKTKLGLNPSEYETMTSIIDTIYHAAATVNFVLPFSALQNGVDEILKFAMAVKIKPFHYISSVAVHGDKNKSFSGSKVFEDTDLNCSVDLIPQNGYAQMKWVSEKLVRLAAARGLPVTIFRPSYVSGHSQTGSVALHEFVSRLIKDCVRAKCYPNVDLPLQLVPVDFVSSSVVKISLDAKCFGKVFHLTPPCLTSDVTIRGLMGYVGRCGFEMAGVECGKWLEMLERKVDADWALYPLLGFVSGYLGSSASDFWEFDATNVRDALGHAQIETNVIDFNCVKVMIDFLIDCQFLTKS